VLVLVVISYIHSRDQHSIYRARARYTSPCEVHYHSCSL